MADIVLPLETSDSYPVETSDGYPVNTYTTLDDLDYPLSAELNQITYTAEFYQLIYNAELNQ